MSSKAKVLNIWQVTTTKQTKRQFGNAYRIIRQVNVVLRSKSKTTCQILCDIKSVGQNVNPKCRGCDDLLARTDVDGWTKENIVGRKNKLLFLFRNFSFRIYKMQKRERVCVTKNAYRTIKDGNIFDVQIPIYSMSVSVFVCECVHMCLQKMLDSFSRTYTHTHTHASSPHTLHTHF